MINKVFDLLLVLRYNRHRELDPNYIPLSDCKLIKIKGLILDGLGWAIYLKSQTELNVSPDSYYIGNAIFQLAPALALNQQLNAVPNTCITVTL